MKKPQRIAILTGGGDAPGINAVIRAVAKHAILEHGLEVIGIVDGYEGLVHNRHRKLSYDDVSGILTQGGTILGASKTSNPYQYAVTEGGKIVFQDLSRKAIETVRGLDVDALVCIGGDGTLGIAHRLMKDGIPVVGVPKTIDNDLRGTDITFGFDTAVAIATEAIDRLHTTAQSHHRIMIIEVMGHWTGWIALYSGVAGGGDIILIPEIPFTVEAVADKIEERSKRGRRFSIVVVAEGAKPLGGDNVIRRMVEKSADPVRLGGIGFVLQEQLEKATGREARTVVLGHLLRGGSPTAADRVLSTQFGSHALELIMRARRAGWWRSRAAISPTSRSKSRPAGRGRFPPIIPSSRPPARSAPASANSRGQAPPRGQFWSWGQFWRGDCPP